MGRFVVSLLIGAGLILSTAGAPVWAAAGTVYGQVVSTTGQAPDQQDFSLVALVNNSDETIHTENAYNSPLGYKQGYQIDKGKGYFFINFGNFRGATDGQAYKAVLTSLSDNSQATLTGTIPGNYSGLTDVVKLQAATAPRAPKVTAAWDAKGVVLTWVPENGVTYKVYRSLLPSGAANHHSNGVFQKVGEGLNGSYTDSSLRRTQTAWYVVVPEKAGLLGAHSEEAVAGAELLAPELKNPGVQLQNPGTIQEQGAPAQVK